MGDGPLSPQARMDLQIQLDRVRNAGERCREALRGYASGQLTRETYFGLLDEQRQAWSDWEERQRKYFR